MTVVAAWTPGNARTMETHRQAAIRSCHIGRRARSDTKPTDTKPSVPWSYQLVNTRPRSRGRRNTPRPLIFDSHNNAAPHNEFGVITRSSGHTPKADR